MNRQWVINLYDVLRQQGFEVFLDQVVLRGGDSLIRVLEDGLGKSQAGVLVWSTAASESEWVFREYQTLESRAKQKGSFCFVPVRLDAKDLPLFASTRVFLDFSNYPDGPSGGELLRLLHAVVGQSLSPDAMHFADEQDRQAQKAAHEIAAAIRIKDPALIQQLFDAGGLVWEASSALGCKAAEGLIKLGKNSDAIAMLQQLEQQFPVAVRPIQLHALALARRGADDDLRQAQLMLGTLYEDGQRDPETLGIFGRTWMDRYAKSGDIMDLKQSRDLYAEAFKGARDDYYTGINAASKSVLIGAPEDIEKGREYASQVEDIVGTGPHPGDYWKTATVGEVLLLKGSYADAATRYADAISYAPAETGSHGSTYLQAQRLMEKLGTSEEDARPIHKTFVHLRKQDPTRV